jgi:hypothetical protein
MIETCNATHGTTGAVCELASGHVENHRGPFRGGVAQWPPVCRCGQTRSSHCDLDGPGVDHASGCELMHHEFREPR